MMREQPTYRFKDIAMDLESYLSERKVHALQLRRDAERLTRQAAQIDEEWQRLESALVLVEKPQ